MRILHTSDLHLGISLMGRSLLEHQRYLIEELAKTVRQERIDAVLISGDLFDRSVVAAEVIELYNELATRLCIGQGVKVFAIAGNHDGAERLASCSALLEQAGLYVAGRLREGPRHVRLEQRGEAVNFFLLPYFNPDEVRSLTGKPARDMQEALQILLADWMPAPVPGERNILLAHLFVRGGVTAGSDRTAVIGGAAVVGAQSMEAFDYVALGHLHAPQKVGKNAYYSGTPLPYSFSEKDHQKRFLVLDTEDLSLREIPIQAPYCLREERGTLEALKKQAEDHPSQDYLRLEVTDARIAKEDYELFRSAYPNLLLAYSSAYAPGEDTALSPEQVEQLSAEAILQEFLQEQESRDPSQEEVQWFLRAMEQAEKGALL